MPTIKQVLTKLLDTLKEATWYHKSIMIAMYGDYLMKQYPQWINIIDHELSSDIKQHEKRQVFLDLDILKYRTGSEEDQDQVKIAACKTILAYYKDPIRNWKKKQLSKELINVLCHIKIFFKHIEEKKKPKPHEVGSFGLSLARAKILDDIKCYGIEYCNEKYSFNVQQI